MSDFFSTKPDDFDERIGVSTCFLEHEGKLLVLKYAQNAIGKDLWAIPGGKLEKGESPKAALIRELQEETQISLADRDSIEMIQHVYVRHKIYDYTLYLYRITLEKRPEILIDPAEHTEFNWVDIENFSTLPLIEGQLEAFHLAYPSLKIST